MHMFKHKIFKILWNSIFKEALPCWQAGKADIALSWLVNLIDLWYKVVDNRLQLLAKWVQNVFFQVLIISKEWDVITDTSV